MLTTPRKVEVSVLKNSTILQKKIEEKPKEFDKNCQHPISSSF
jgi:hypothetical protein